MKALILGSAENVDFYLAEALEKQGIEYIQSSFKSPKFNIQEQQQFVQVLHNVDVIINCGEQGYDGIVSVAKLMVEAAIEANKPRIIHISSMSVYGNFEGNADEKTPLGENLGWYAEAKIKAEDEIKRYCNAGGFGVILRPGCIYGKGSELWVGRIARLLISRRLGDLGANGDGWTNLLHIDDCIQAIINSMSIKLNHGELALFNLADPSAPRWNKYLIDLAKAVKATPVKRIGALRLKLEGKLLAAVLKVAQIIAKKLKVSTQRIPDPIPPSLMRAFSQEIRLDSNLAIKMQIITFKKYQSGIKQSAEWFCASIN